MEPTFRHRRIIIEPDHNSWFEHTESHFNMTPVGETHHLRIILE